MRNYIKLSVLFLGLFFASCEDFLEQQQDPNNLSPDQADPNFLTNNIQISFNDFFADLSDDGMEMTRMLNSGGSTYESARAPQSFDNAWTIAYASVLSDINVLKPIAYEKELYQQLGIAYALEATTLVYLVDMFGDVPYSEALNSSNFNPIADEGENIYASALTLFDSAIVNFNKASSTTGLVDFFHSSYDSDNWIAFCNTMKLRMALTTRLVDSNAGSKISALLSENLIDDPSEDFAFSYSSNALNPDSRHPRFIDNYISGAADYQANYFLFKLLEDKSVIDPRTRYYVYRQQGTIPTDANVLPCINETKPNHYDLDDPFCNLGNGWWGRDHLDNDGIPPDGLARTNWGSYPAGGSYDANTFNTADDFTQGLQGAGIQPIMLTSFVYFMRAEAALLLSTGEDVEAMLDSAITYSMNKVVTADNRHGEDNEDETTPAEYLTEVLDMYADAANDDERLDIIITEYYLSAFGNGFEAYNNYRRTSFPSDIQPALNSSPGKYFRSLTYPSVYVARNLNAEVKSGNGVTVFWDTNPDNFDF